MRKILLIILLSVFFSVQFQAQDGLPDQVKGVYPLSVEQARDIINDQAENLDLPGWLLNLLIDVRYPLVAYSVEYPTLAVNPQNLNPPPLVMATGLVIVPQNTGCDQLPTALYCHGTIFGNDNVPSNPLDLKEDLIAALAFAGHGYVTVLPDYVGYGDDPNVVRHPYLDARTEAAASIDLLRLVAGFSIQYPHLLNLSMELFITGHSQGGHAGMAALRSLSLEESYGFEVKFAGLSSGPYDLSGEQFDYVFGNDTYPGDELTLMVLEGCIVSSCPPSSGTLDFCDPGDVLDLDRTDPDVSYFWELVVDQVEGARETITSDSWRDFFLGGPDGYLSKLEGANDLRDVCLYNNNVYRWRNLNKTTMYYCGSDLRVDPDNAHKTKAVQRDLIPWYWFWKKWQINTFYSGNFDHFNCALPSLYFTRVAFDRNRDCCPHWKSAGHSAQQQTAGIVVPSFLFFDAEVDFSQYRGQLVGVKLLDQQDAVVQQWGKEDLQTKRLTIPRNNLEVGIYGLEFEDVSGKKIYAVIMIQDPEPAVSELYDPISPNPMQRQAKLDISLLQDPVSKISIYDTQGNLYRRFSVNPDASEVVLERNDLPTGEYLVEVRTTRQSYFLPLEMVPMPMDGYLIAPNPMRDQAWIDLSQLDGFVQAIQLFTLDGQLLRTYTDVAEDAAYFELQRGDLSGGVYLLEIKTTMGKKVAKLVVD